MKKTLIICFCLTLANFLDAADIWQREVVNYDRKTYAAAAQNWMIDQSDKGWIYAANSEGLLEFDGIKWTIYQIKNQMVRSVKVIGERIYVGGSMEFGYFEADEIGKLNYISLSHNLPSWGGDVWNILKLDNFLYFISDKDIFAYNLDSKEMQNIKSKAKFNSSCIYENKVMLGTSDGVAYLNQAQRIISYLSPTEGIAQYKIVKLLPYKDKLIAVTAMNGIYYVNDDTQPTKIEIDRESFIQVNQIFSAVIVETKLILGSVQNGLLIVDLERKALPETLNISKGLKTNTVLNIFIDRLNNLWLALDKGVSYVDLSSPLRPLFANISPIGSGYCSILYNGKIYFGTNQGMYTFEDGEQARLVKGTEGQIWSLNIINGELFCSGDNGITVITKTEQYKIGITGVWETHLLNENEATIVAGLYSGIAVLKKRNGKWSYSHKTETHGFMRSFVKDEEPNTFFFIRDNDSIVKCTFNKELTAIKNEKTYPIPGGVIYENRYLRKINNQITVCTQNGIYAYNNLSDSFYKYTQLEEKLSGASYYSHLSVDRFNNIWYGNDKTLKVLQYVGAGYANKSKNMGSVTDEMTDNPEIIFALDSVNFIMATEDGFSKFHLEHKVSNKHLPIQVYIRSLSCGREDSIISYGRNQVPPVIDYKNNSVKIEYSATQFSRNSDIKYLLRFKDSEWGNPTSNTGKEYTNLFEGNYELQVMAVDNISGEISKTASIRFTILPPWYRSSFAYISYLLALCILLYISYKLTIGKQGKIIHQQKLESEMKDQEIYKLQNKNLKDELQYKTQELSGYILNMIRKNEMLEEVKKNAYGITQAIDNNKPNTTIKQKTLQLIGLVNNNIEKDSDFEVFQSNFNIVHQDFFNLLDKDIPSLTRGDKILCAYLSMDLSTKEIAQLLNISIRGVEVNRYRLRKKIGLSRDENLTEYIQNIKS